MACENLFLLSLYKWTWVLYDHALPWRRLHKTRTLLSNKISFKKTVRLKPGNVENDPVLMRPPLCLPPTVCPLVILDGPQIQHLVHFRLSQASPSPSSSHFFPYILPQSYMTSQYNCILTWSQGRSDTMAANAGVPLYWIFSYCPFGSALSSSPLFLFPSCWPPDPSRFCDPLASAWA